MKNAGRNSEKIPAPESVCICSDKKLDFSAGNCVYFRIGMPVKNAGGSCRGLKTSTEEGGLCFVSKRKAEFIDHINISCKDMMCNIPSARRIAESDNFTYNISIQKKQKTVNRNIAAK